MKDSFNADFYTTAATVIPVLYIALAVQLDSLSMWLYRVTIRKGAREKRLTVIILVLALALPLLFSLIGEGCALWALCYKESMPWILFSAIILVVVTAFVTFRELATTSVKVATIKLGDILSERRAHGSAISRADYRRMFSQEKTPEDAELDAGRYIYSSPLPDSPEHYIPGDATPQEIRNVLDEVWPPSDGRPRDIDRLRKVAEDWFRASANDESQ
jgi:hypothetical protein